MQTEKLYTKTEEYTDDRNCGGIVDDSEQRNKRTPYTRVYGQMSSR